MPRGKACYNCIERDEQWPSCRTTLNGWLAKGWDMAALPRHSQDLQQLPEK